jgi:hypothetical protein
MACLGATRRKAANVSFVAALTRLGVDHEEITSLAAPGASSSRPVPHDVEFIRLEVAAGSR